MSQSISVSILFKCRHPLGSVHSVVTHPSNIPDCYRMLIIWYIYIFIKDTQCIPKRLYICFDVLYRNNTEMNIINEARATKTHLWWSSLLSYQDRGPTNLFFWWGGFFVTIWQWQRHWKRQVLATHDSYNMLDIGLWYGSWQTSVKWYNLSQLVAKKVSFSRVLFQIMIWNVEAV